MVKDNDEDFKVPKKKIKARNETDVIIDVYDKTGRLIINDGEEVE